ncbi:MAG: hypothetical protein HC769_26300 [Cyanobacteria bacterium CRU_2_1]|nr:hypothetical protein [Cyanobacteria bacterium RU_5_0]NJR62032.1 hypothetical protein [Cyanobacteria bacterium CRU_2_1]
MKIPSPRLGQQYFAAHNKYLSYVKQRSPSNPHLPTSVREALLAILGTSAFLPKALPPKPDNPAFLRQNEAQNPKRRANCSTFQVLSLTDRPLRSNHQPIFYTVAPSGCTFRDLRANRLPISSATASNPDPFPLALAKL